MKRKYFFISGLFLNLLALIIFPAHTAGQMTSAKNLSSRKSFDRKSNDLSTLEFQVFEQINQKRAADGLDLLVWNKQVAAVARLHSANMATFGFFSHTGMDGKKVDDRADSLGLQKWRMIGENIAYNVGFENPVERAVSGWMQSAGHRKNILRNGWKETGIGISVSASGKFYITQVFLQRK